MQTTREKLLDDIDSFIGRTGIAESRIGIEVMNDTSLISRLRKGKTITIETLDALTVYMQHAVKRGKKS